MQNRQCHREVPDVTCVGLAVVGDRAEAVERPDAVDSMDSVDSVESVDAVDSVDEADAVESADEATVDLHVLSPVTVPAERAYLAQVIREPRRFLRRRTGDADAVPDRSVDEPEHPIARRARRTSLAAAFTLLAGCLLVAGIRAGHPANAAQPGRAAPTQFDGAAALGGFAEATEPGVVPAGEQDFTASARSDEGTDRAGVVRQFYALVNSAPARALAMLAPSVLPGNQVAEVARAWNSTNRVTMDDVRTQPDGSVLATVTMFRRDGSRLHLSQSFRLGTDGMITEVRLLGAQRM